MGVFDKEIKIDVHVLSKIVGNEYLEYIYTKINNRNLVKKEFMSKMNNSCFVQNEPL